LWLAEQAVNQNPFECQFRVVADIEFADLWVFLQGRRIRTIFYSRETVSFRFTRANSAGPATKDFSRNESDTYGTLASTHFVEPVPVRSGLSVWNCRNWRRGRDSITVISSKC